MKILYFSSTGNSLYVVKKLGGEMIARPKAMKEGTYSFEEDSIGVVFPVYWLSVPAVVRQFLSKASFTCDYLFGIVTYGDNMFGAMNDLNTISLANGRTFDYINAVKMTENYLPMYEMKQEIEKAEDYHTEDVLAKVCGEIKKQVHYIPKNSWFSKCLTNRYKKKHCMEMGAGEASQFTVSADCILCGQCVRICPMENVTISDQKIIFGQRCADCLGCIQNCPKGAIHTEKEKSGARYRNPYVKVSELE